MVKINLKKYTKFIIAFFIIIFLGIKLSHGLGTQSIVISSADGNSFHFNAEYKKNNGTQSAQYQYYGNTVFYRTMYKPSKDSNNDQFLIYIPYNPSSGQPLSQFDFGQIYENHLNKYAGIAYVAPGGNQNLKMGSATVNMHDYLGDESGSMRVYSGGSYHQWEYRYMGYNDMGYPMNNPLFPADGLAQDWWTPWVMHDWWVNNINFDEFETASPYAGLPVADGWWTNTVFPMPSQSFNDTAYTEGLQPLAFWKTRMEFENDPTLSAGILKGFFSNGSYSTYTLNSQNMPNLRMMDYKITDDAGNMIAEVTRGDDPKGVLSAPIKNNPYLTRGKTYHIQAVVKNMTPPNHDTTYTPVSVDSQYAHDANAWKTATYDEETDGIVSSDNPKSIPAGGTATFKWDYIVPASIVNDLKLGAKISDGFFTAGDNFYPDDDKSEIRLQVQPEDMAMNANAELYDYTGTQVNYPIDGYPYKFKMYVDKVQGDTSVPNTSSPNPTTDPYVTVDVTINSVGASQETQVVKATGKLLPNGQVEVWVNNFIAHSSHLIITATIDPIHHQLGENNDLSNDTKSWDFASNLNYSVQNLVVAPASINLPQGQSSASEFLTFTFDAMLATNNPSDKTPRQVPVVLSSNYSVINQQNITLTPGEVQTVTVQIPNFMVSQGTIPFKAEINPQPNRQVEYKGTNIDPYADNIATTTMLVTQNVIPEVCTVKHTNNTWYQYYYVSHWTGYWRTYCWSSPFGGGCYTYCVYNFTYPNRSMTNYENFNISHVFFRSKMTSDLGYASSQGAGWVDILGQGPSNTQGQIKAGYSFQMITQTYFETNTWQAPQPYSYGCSEGQNVYPQTQYIYTPNDITLTFPDWKDVNGNPVTQKLYGYSYGNWYSNTTTYTLQPRNAFGITTIPAIFIDKETRDGVYPVQIDTHPFYGTTIKGWGYPNLCDPETVYIRVQGSMYDDLKTQIVE